MSRSRPCGSRPTNQRMESARLGSVVSIGQGERAGIILGDDGGEARPDHLGEEAVVLVFRTGGERGRRGQRGVTMLFRGVVLVFRMRGERGGQIPGERRVERGQGRGQREAHGGGGIFLREAEQRRRWSRSGWPAFSVASCTAHERTMSLSCWENFVNCAESSAPITWRVHNARRTCATSVPAASCWSRAMAGGSMGCCVARSCKIPRAWRDYQSL